MAPVVRGRKGEYVKQIESYKKAGYTRVRIDGIDYTLDEELPKLEKNVKHTISVVVDRLVIKEGVERRLTDSLELALKLAEGLVTVDVDGTESLYSTNYSCPDCDISIEELSPRSFSFNNPYGACPECLGLGYKCVMTRPNWSRTTIFPSTKARLRLQPTGASTFRKASTEP